MLWLERFVVDEGTSAPGIGNDSMDWETVEIPRRVWNEVVAHLVRALPMEGCGLLAFRRREAMATAVAFFPGDNVDRSPTRFTMEPRDVLRTLSEIDRRNLVLGAIVHSHPTTPATPSPLDLAEARYPGALLGIVGMAPLPPRLRFWRLPGDEETVPVEVAWRVAG